ncbi:MAG TPA: hypothetical protein VFV92_07410 [Candidatus Bathyarchaeia archaeon]|nr:hypothetical protein [Candidatus Bathyarchaeia archaeon]
MEKLVSIPVKGNHIQIVEVFDMAKPGGFSDYAGEGSQLFTVIVAARSLKDLENNVSELKKIMDRQGWSTR